MESVNGLAETISSLELVDTLTTDTGGDHIGVQHTVLKTQPLFIRNSFKPFPRWS